MLPTIHMCGDSSLSKQEVDKANKRIMLTDIMQPSFDDHHSH